MFEEAKKDDEKEVESLMQAYELENYLDSSKLIDVKLTSRVFNYDNFVIFRSRLADTRPLLCR
jgi:hypothetical protein